MGDPIYLRIDVVDYLKTISIHKKLTIMIISKNIINKYCQKMRVKFTSSDDTAGEGFWKG